MVLELKWKGASYATSYDVYLGTSSSPPFWGSTTSFNGTATGLAVNTTYYWKVVANTLNGPVSSPIWSFSTTPICTISTLAGSGQEGFSGDNGRRQKPLCPSLEIWYWIGPAISTLRIAETTGFGG